LHRGHVTVVGFSLENQESRLPTPVGSPNSYPGLPASPLRSEAASFAPEGPPREALVDPVSTWARLAALPDMAEVFCVLSG
jgi:hypothetical protein